MAILNLKQDGSLVSFNPFETPNSTALGLLGVGQFLEAEYSGYIGFELFDLKERAYSLLQKQLHIIFEISFIKFVNENLKLKKSLNFLRSVKPCHFQISPDEINQFLSKPHFLWRFSKNNYKYFEKIFINKQTACQNQLQMYFIDNSGPVEYYTESDKIRGSIRFHTFKKIKHRVKDKTTNRIIELSENLLHHKLDRFEQIEIQYSDDFGLHGINENFMYTDFICTMITGHTSKRSEKISIAKYSISNSGSKSYKAKPSKTVNLRSLFERPEVEILNTYHIEKYTNKCISSVTQKQKYVDTDWCHESLMTKSEYPFNFYQTVYSIFGDETNINNERYCRVDENGNKMRGPWYIPCSLKEEINALLKYVDSVNLCSLQRLIKSSKFDFLCKDYHGVQSYKFPEKNRVYHNAMRSPVHYYEPLEHCKRNISHYHSALLSLYGYDNESKMIDLRESFFSGLEGSTERAGQMFVEENFHILNQSAETTEDNFWLKINTNSPSATYKMMFKDPGKNNTKTRKKQNEFDYNHNKTFRIKNCTWRMLPAAVIRRKNSTEASQISLQAKNLKFENKEIENRQNEDAVSVRKTKSKSLLNLWEREEHENSETFKFNLVVN